MFVYGGGYGGGGGGGPELSWTAGGGGSELYELDGPMGGGGRLGDETKDSKNSRLSVSTVDFGKECELDGRGACAAC